MIWQVDVYELEPKLHERQWKARQQRARDDAGAIRPPSGGGSGKRTTAAARLAAARAAEAAKAAAKAAAQAAPPPRGWRGLDETGELTKRLAQQQRQGDPGNQGVVWPRIAEVGLLVALGGGGTLLRYALQQMQAEGWYEFAITQVRRACLHATVEKRPSRELRRARNHSRRSSSGPSDYG